LRNAFSPEIERNGMLSEGARCVGAIRRPRRALAAGRRRSEARENRAGDIALEALQRLRDFADVSRLRPVPPRRDDRRADTGGHDIGVGALQRRRSVVDHHAVIALGVLRQGQELLGAQQLLRVGRRCAGDK
jgi:hypothetical protein